MSVEHLEGFAKLAYNGNIIPLRHLPCFSFSCIHWYELPREREAEGGPAGWAVGLEYI